MIVTRRVLGACALIAGLVFSGLLIVPANAAALWTWTGAKYPCTHWDAKSGTNACISGTGFNPKTSTWGMGVNSKGNCVNYAAFRLSKNGGAELKKANSPSKGSRDALYWKDIVAKQFGSSHVNKTPKVGSIAYWGKNQGGNGASGHVGYVEKVSGTTVYLTESGWDRGSRTRVLKKGDSKYPVYFLHIKDKP